MGHRRIQYDLATKQQNDVFSGIGIVLKHLAKQSARSCGDRRVRKASHIDELTIIVTKTTETRS